MVKLDMDDRKVWLALCQFRDRPHIDSRDLRIASGLTAAQVRVSVLRLRWAGLVAFDQLALSPSADAACNALLFPTLSHRPAAPVAPEPARPRPAPRKAKPARTVIPATKRVETRPNVAPIAEAVPAPLPVGPAVAKPPVPVKTSWVETYRRPVVEQPIDPLAFRERARQRSVNGRVDVADATRSVKEVGGAAKLRAMVAARSQADAARLASPIEQAKSFLQRKGRVVYAAHVVRPGETGWIVSGCGREAINDDALVELATAQGWGA